MTKYERFKRSVRFWWQRRTRGWDDSDTRNMDRVFAEFMLPRVRRYQEISSVCWINPETHYPAPQTSKYMNDCLDEIIWFLEIHASDEGTWQLIGDEKMTERYDKAKIIFAEHFGSLWW